MKKGKDIRDLRDVRKMGEAWAHFRRMFSDVPASEIADLIDEVPIAHYPPDESLATITAREYREELEAAAGNGDIYAQSQLDRLDRGSGREFSDQTAVESF